MTLEGALILQNQCGSSLVETAMDEGKPVPLLVMGGKTLKRTFKFLMIIYCICSLPFFQGAPSPWTKGMTGLRPPNKLPDCMGI